MAPSPDVTWTPFTTRSPNVDPSALLVARAPLLVLLTVAVRLLAVISPFSRFTLNTVATLCTAVASPIDPDVVPVSPSVVIVPGTFSSSASPAAMAPSAGATAGSSASADCCVPPGPCTNAPYALPLTDCAGVTGASAAVTPFNSHSATTTCTARILERLIVRPVLSRSLVCLDVAAREIRLAGLAAILERDAIAVRASPRTRPRLTIVTSDGAELFLHPAPIAVLHPRRSGERSAPPAPSPGIVEREEVVDCQAVNQGFGRMIHGLELARDRALARARVRRVDVEAEGRLPSLRRVDAAAAREARARRTRRGAVRKRGFGTRRGRGSIAAPRE